MNTNEKIQRIRGLMRQYKIDAYIVQDNDPHQSEYVAQSWKFRNWISGFTGSNGTLVITLEESGIWTDGRYFIQAESQIQDSEIVLYRQGDTNVPSYEQWIKDRLNAKGCVGYYGTVFSRAQEKSLKSCLGSNITLNCDYDLVGLIWKHRPKTVFNEIYNHVSEYSGASISEKLKMVRNMMEKQKVDYHIIGSLDDIAWLFNIRGNDIPNNPVAMGYTLITLNTCKLFVNLESLTNTTYQTLKSNVQVYEYQDIVHEISKIKSKASVYIEPGKINCTVYNSIPKGCEIVEGVNFTTSLKALKNEVELKNLVNCQTKDGVAMVNFIHWLKTTRDKEQITEYDLVKKLEYFRNKQKNYRGPSFNPIIGYKDHAAMMHYEPTEESHYKLSSESMVLIDSGGQYLDGTTDITRTISLGKLSKQEKKDFTLVLKGHIAIARAKFLYGATGANLDSLARAPLWQEGINYNCGTGHGVGYFLSVHEGPQGFSQFNTVKLEENMILTIEPGIYREGKHGVRIENTYVVTVDEKTDFGQFMKFKVISYCPIDLDAVDKKILDDSEKMWINEYHREVYERVSQHVNDEVESWLKENTKPI